MRGKKEIGVYMTKKKLIIYLFTFIVFVGLLAIYTSNTIQTTNKVDEQKIANMVEVTEVQIRRNIEYIVKELQLQLSEQKLLVEASASKAQEVVANMKDEDIYFMNEDGILHRDGGIYDEKKIDKSILKKADKNGYHAFGFKRVTKELDMGLIVPVSGRSYYYVQVFNVKEYLAHITDNLHVPETSMVLFDEWGNVISSYDTKKKEAEAVKEGGADYERNRIERKFRRDGFKQSYNVYFEINTPEGWFLGTNVTYSHQNLLFSSIPKQTIVIFGVLILILAVVIVLDVINDKEKKKELFLVSNIDHLTGLVNSTGLEEAVEEFLRRYPVTGYDFICMDIIAFSRINTMFGYSTGDMVLRTMAAVIKERYFCGIRVNADCFAFFAKHSDDMIDILKGSFYDAIEKHMGSEYIQMLLFKFGIYPVRDSKVSCREIYDGALLALKDAKKKGRKNQVVFDTNLKQTTELQKNIEINMMQALSKEEFVVYVQPQLGLTDSRCLRGETLIRWQSEFMGFLPPDKFIPIFEGNGFIVETDFFMLSSALSFLERRIKEGKEPLTLAINQSKVTITFPNYYERLKALIEQYDVPLEYIELEVTESTLENDWEKIVPLIHSIKRLGFSIAMDDFGSGFSSLNTLRILPINILKIDKTFLKESDSSDRSKIIIKNIINMSKELQIKVVCEGVETEAQLEFLKRAGCDIIQGYYYSKPLPMDEFSERYL